MIKEAIEHCGFDDVLKGECTPEIRASVGTYLSQFAKPNEKGECINCGVIQGGLQAAIFGGFEYGLAHGEGRCSKCGWPGRANHYFKDAEGKEFGSLKIILQYHPDLVSKT